MARRSKVYEGKAKILFAGTEPGTLVQHFKDDAVRRAEKLQGTVNGKGVLNNIISEYLMLRLHDIGIPNHFIRRVNMREQLVREVEIVPIIITIRNVAAGSMSARLGIPEGTPLPRSIAEYAFKSDPLMDPMIAEEHITAFGWASPQDIDDILAMSLRINDFLSGLFMGVGLKLVDFKLEFGRIYDENGEMRIILADELSPDNCRLWDVRSGDKMGLDRFHLELGGAEESYQEVARRLGVLPEGDVKNLAEVDSAQ